MIKLRLFPDPSRDLKDTSGDNPHFLMLLNAWKNLAQRDIEIVMGNKTHDATLVLWPDSILEKCLTSPILRLVRVFKIHLAQKIASRLLDKLVERECKKIRGMTGLVFWQIHEIIGHNVDPQYQHLDRKIRQTLVTRCNSLFITEESTRASIESYFDTQNKQSVVSHLGGYRKYYGADAISKLEREKYGIPPTKTTILVFGRARKNSDFTTMYKALSNCGFYLILAGQGYKTLDLGTENCLEISKFVSKNEVAKLFSIADYVLKPEPEYLNSGVIRLAISYFKPVIAHRFGATEDLAKDCLVDLSSPKWIDAIPSRDSLEYEEMVSSAIMRDSERDWESAAQAMHNTIFQCWKSTLEL